MINGTPRPLSFPESDPVTITGRVGGPRGRSGPVRIISMSLGFDPQTLQEVGSRITYCAIQTYHTDIHTQ